MAASAQYIRPPNHAKKSVAKGAEPSVRQPNTAAQTASLAPTTYGYDDLNRLTSKTYPDTTSVAYEYDLVSKPTEVSDPTGTYVFSYDNMGRLTGTTTSYSFLTARNFTTADTYDVGSNLTAFTDPEGGTTTYTYDTLNRLTALAPPQAFGSGSFGFGYDGLSRRTQMSRPNNINTNYTYDNLSRLLSVLHQKGSSTIDGSSYGLDNAGNRTSKTDWLANVTSNYTYDQIFELTQVTQGNNATESYTYNPVHNRLSSQGVASYAYNNSNELTSTSNASYTYDNNGNVVSKTDSTGTTTYAWDFDNRLTSVTLPGSGGTVTLKYDPFGRRIYKSSSQGTSIFAYGGSRLIETVNSSGIVVARYIYGMGVDEPLAELQSGTTSYYEADGLGSITSLTSSAGALAQTYTYDSFGKQTAASGSMTNPFRYTGREFDTETNLSYNRARYYDPATGRFLGEDPIRFKGGINFYSYTGNNPINRVDPSGLCPQDDQPQGPCINVPGNALSFVATNYQDAQTIASTLGTSAANILGLSGNESAWGTSPLAQNSNNYFGLTYPYPGNNGSYSSPNGYTYSTYSNPGFLNSGMGFAAGRQGQRVAALPAISPNTFAWALTTPPYAFNSEPGTYQSYVNAIAAAQAAIDCLFGGN